MISMSCMGFDVHSEFLHRGSVLRGEARIAGHRLATVNVVYYRKAYSPSRMIEIRNYE
jgi:hypothetical protein